jgi:hypothetical protein
MERYPDSRICVALVMKRGLSDVIKLPVAAPANRLRVTTMGIITILRC